MPKQSRSVPAEIYLNMLYIDSMTETLNSIEEAALADFESSKGTTEPGVKPELRARALKVRDQIKRLDKDLKELYAEVSNNKGETSE